MAVVTLEDTKGMVEMVVFADLYVYCEHYLASEKPLVVTATLERRDEGGVRMVARNILFLEDVAREMGKRINLKIDCQVFKKDDLRRLRDILLGLRGRAKVSLEFYLNEERKSLHIKDLLVEPSRMDVVLKNFPNGISVEVIDETLS